MTGTLALPLIGGHLSAQTAPLSGGALSPGATPTDLSTYEAQPRLYTGPKGETLRLWYRGLPPGIGGVLLGVAAPSDAWKTLVEIIPQEKDTTAGTPDFAVGPAGELTVAYQWWRRVPSSKQIRVARSTDGGKTWIQPSTPLDTSGKAFAPKVAWGRGQSLVVVWSDEQRSTNVGNRVWDIYARSSPDGGSTWGPEQLLSRFPSNAQTDAYIRPELVSDSEDNFWAVWVGIRSGRSRLFVSRSKDGGRSWADPMEVSGQSQSVFGQRVVRAGQRMLIVWQDKRTGRDRLYSVSSSDNGATWTTPAPIGQLAPGQATDAFAPAVVMDPSGGEVLVAWQDGRNGRDDIFLGRSLDGGRTWEDKDIRLDMDEQGTAVSRFSSIARAADGRIAIAWEDDRAGFEGIYLRVRSSGAQPTWGPEIMIEPPGPKKAVRLPSVVWSTDGSLYVAWEVWNYVGGNMAVTKRIDGRKLVFDKK